MGEYVLYAVPYSSDDRTTSRRFLICPTSDFEAVTELGICHFNTPGPDYELDQALTPKELLSVLEGLERMLRPTDTILCSAGPLTVRNQAEVRTLRKFLATPDLQVA